MKKQINLILFGMLLVVILSSLKSTEYVTVYEEIEGSRPLILVHGHGTVVAAHSMELLKNRLSKDKYYIDKGAVHLRDSAVPNSWPKNSVVSMSYYETGHSNISTYADRLKTVVDIVRNNTDSSKVDIVAHSMGGLVSRKYIKSYENGNSVSTLITLGTPNHGSNLLRVKTFCPRTQTECKDILTGSVFLNDLNAGDETPFSIKYVTIAGDIGDGTDGVIEKSSVPLNGSINYEFKGISHSDLLYPFSPAKIQVYDTIKYSLLKNITLSKTTSSTRPITELWMLIKNALLN